MSSHHFVKEQQEPAVFMLEVEGISFETVAPLFEWSPTVLVDQESVEVVVSWGIKIDVILATSSFQKGNMQLLEEQYPTRFLTISASKSLEEGLQYLVASQHKGVHLVGLDHLQCLRLEEKTSFLDLTVVDGDWKYYPVKEGKFSKWFVPSEIRLLAAENQPVEVSNANGQILFPICYLTHLEVPAGNSTFSSTGIFWIGERVLG
ncbi:MAG: thiamine pyrophosphokinase [Bacteroidetes bacterium]|nr:thiamine pyrophosphokinase [Bacteroidota bacterium]MDA1267521.1 thiamine pyrophosphokinase [Bacteroidota bacterium]